MVSVRRRGRRVRVTFTPDEADLLLDLLGQVIELLGPGEPADDVSTADPIGELDETELLEQLFDSPGSAAPPSDPVLRRLLPDGYRNDDDAAGEFRRLTETSLRATKRTALQRVIDDLSTAAAEADPAEGEVQLDLRAADAESWLPALTDLRLALGTRIGVTEDMAEEFATVEPGSARFAELETYDWVTWLQNSIVLGVMRGLTS